MAAITFPFINAGQSEASKPKRDPLHTRLNKGPPTKESLPKHNALLSQIGWSHWAQWGLGGSTFEDSGHHLLAAHKNALVSMLTP